MGRFLNITLSFLIVLSSTYGVSYFYAEAPSQQISLSQDSVPDLPSEQTEADESSDREISKKEISLTSDSELKEFIHKIARQVPKGELHTFLDSYTDSFNIPPMCS